MKTITAMNLKTRKYEKLTNSGRKDKWNKVVWLTSDGRTAEVSTSRYCGKINYYYFYVYEH